MDKKTPTKRAPLRLGSARALTQGNVMGNKDESLIGGRYYG